MQPGLGDIHQDAGEKLEGIEGLGELARGRGALAPVAYLWCLLVEGESLGVQRGAEQVASEPLHGGRVLGLDGD
jgi:hypothetical protein